jgi:phage-related tail fiber protein
MPITINGSGTVTGISAGGLPEGTVTETTLSTSAIQLVAPAGAVAFVCQSLAPTGWLKANGAAVSRTAYAALFAALGTTFGAGNGSTTFNLPDLRGEFPRGWDDSRGIDSGRGIGSFQEGSGHYFSNGGFTITGDDNIVNGERSFSLTNFNTITVSGALNQNPSKTWLRSRPRNIALLAVIKF